jgi:hypothetical protein
MKSNVAGDFCVLYVEPTDEKTALIEFISAQHKPVVLMLPVQSRLKVFQHPDDFNDLKQVKRQLDLPLVFVTSGNELLRKLAWRNGFPAYVSIDELADSLSTGHLALSRQRTLARKTVPLNPASAEGSSSIKWTAAGDHKDPPFPIPPLSPLQERSSSMRGIAGDHKGPPFLSTPPPSPLQVRAVPPEPISSMLQQSAPKAVSSSQLPRVPMAGSRGRSFPAVLFIMLLLLVGGTGVISYLWFSRLYMLLPVAVPASHIVGRVTFLSSEQLSENSSQGINDEVQIDLHGLSSPAAGKSYCAWLLGDNNMDEAKSILLGKLPVNQGNAYLFYPGDPQHTNLLEFNSRFVVTEEDAAMTPITPSPDYSAWRYYGEIPQSPDPLNSHHYSFLDHMRHLLASEPMLNELELPGGLNNWFYRNTGKLIEWTVSARDRWEESKDLAFVQRQTIRTLTYLDGLSFMPQDLPPDTALPDTSKPCSVGLLDVNGPNQNPASYIGSIVYHLNGLLDAPGSTPGERASVSQIIPALNNVQNWLEKLRADAKQIVTMTNAQLGQPEALSLLNDMVDQANHAYTGQIDPVTGAVREGVAWIHEHLQSLATFTVTQYTAGSSPPEIVPHNNTLALN